MTDVASPRPIGTLLVANRGEIALRVMRTAREMGIETIAIHTELDRAAPHVRAADDAIAVPSYLDIDAVVAAARATGSDAIHPGYGFLSERAAFAAAVEVSGLILVGPSAKVMEQMGDKRAAREVAIAAGVPVLPRADLSEEATAGGGARSDSPAEGFPVLVKAAAGGGGKGMRIVRAPADLADALAAAGREAEAAFGDGALLVERYVEHGRHIEVQVLADAHGNVVHLFERDCSTQRRHQKVIEEAPAPTITDDVRARVTAAAVSLARHVGYRNAGTVEFLLDTETGEAWFLEMNTRLQVEHAVTEAVTGLDLVRLQLMIAAGEALPFRQSELTCTGHAIEARVYAEDPFAGFLPQAGTPTLVRWPTRARVDAALESGQTVSTAYDPMLAKIVVHGPDRESARLRMVAALDATAILGLTTNVGFLRLLVAGDEFRDTTIDTAWLDSAEIEVPDDTTPRRLAAWTDVAVGLMTTAKHPFAPDGWRLGAAPAPVVVELDRPVTVDRSRGLVDGADITELSCGNHTLVATLEGHRHQVVAIVDRGAVEV
ncbi:MAG: acetyl-CoA carboxylase biotin carboxylase subunit, partial [Nocardioidaceae bacterium]